MRIGPWNQYYRETKPYEVTGSYYSRIYRIGSTGSTGRGWSQDGQWKADQGEKSPKKRIGMDKKQLPGISPAEPNEMLQN